MINSIAGLVGIVTSLVLTLVPGIKTWWAAQVSDTKKAIMAFLTLVTGLGVFYLGCSQIDIGIAITCDQAGIMEVVQAVLSAGIGNQLAYLFTPDRIKVNK